MLDRRGINLRFKLLTPLSGPMTLAKHQNEAAPDETCAFLFCPCFSCHFGPGPRI